MYTIATLDDLRRRLNLAETETDSDKDLLRRVQEASHLIESLTQRRYCPQLLTRSVPLEPSVPRLLILPADLLELHAVSDAGGSHDIENIQLLPDDRDAPASILRLAPSAAFRLDHSAAPAVTVVGIWGWHDRWTQAWRDSGDTIRDNALSASAATISVADTAGEENDGFTPRFQVGHLLRIEAEYLRVTAIDRQNHRLTVQRGVQGTAAASHRQESKIETYTPSLPIRDLTVRYAELMLKSNSLLPGEPSPLLERMRRLTA